MTAIILEGQITSPHWSFPKRELPEGAIVELIEATNLPKDEDGNPKYWAKPVPGSTFEPWHIDTLEGSYGVLLHRGDFKLS